MEISKVRGKFKDLSPLKQWIFSNNFHIKVSEPKEKKATATHFLLDGGIWKVPMEKYNEFLKILSTDLQNGEKYYISENRTPIFKFICDLDFYEESEIHIKSIEVIVEKIQEVMKAHFASNTKVIICGTESKKVVIKGNEYIKTGFHLVWPKILINVQHAKELRLKFIDILEKNYGERNSENPWSDVVDLAVYEDNGLRMVGCRKIAPCKECRNREPAKSECQKCSGVGKIDEGRVYRPLSVLPNDNEYLKNIQTDFYVMLLETSISNYNNLQETELIKSLPITDIQVKNNIDSLNTKVENFIRKNFKQNYSKIKVKKVTKNNDTLYKADIDDNFCMNVNRNHTSSGVYFEISQNGIKQRCYCKKTTTDGRICGPCNSYSSKEIPLSKNLSVFLFGSAPVNKKNKKIINYELTKHEINTKTACLNNCKNILWQLENDLLK